MENAHFSIPAFSVALIAYVTVRSDKATGDRARAYSLAVSMSGQCVWPWWIIATAVHSCAGRTDSWSVHDAVFSDK